MRKIMSLSIAVMFALLAIGTWATATSGSHEQVGVSGYRINVLELTSSSKDRPTAGSPAGAHSGFLASLEGLAAQGALAEVDRQMQAAGPDAQLFITGHSKGGAVAALAALRIWTTDATPSRVITFAAPHAGDRAFADV